MIFKSSTHTGARLAAHLASSENEDVRVLPNRNLVSDDIGLAIAQFQAETAGTRAQRGMIHVSASPDPGVAMSQADWNVVWEEYEREFGLGAQAYAGVEHVKRDRRHQHRVFARIAPDGRAVSMSHNYRRQEYVARCIEYRLGHSPTRSKHHRYVLCRLKVERPAVADWVERALGDGPMPEAVCSHREHQQQKRTGIDHAQVAHLVRAAWQASDSQAAFVAALAENSLRVASGDKTIQVIDEVGGTHDLRRTLRAGGARIRKRDIEARIDGATLPNVDTVRQVLLSIEREDRNDPDRARKNVQSGRPGNRPSTQALWDTALRLRTLSARRVAALGAEPRRQGVVADPLSDLLPSDVRPDRPRPAKLQRLRADRSRSAREPSTHEVRIRIDTLTYAIKDTERRLAMLDREASRLLEKAEERLPERRLDGFGAWRDAAAKVDRSEMAYARAVRRRDDDQARVERWGIFRFLLPAYWRGPRNRAAVVRAGQDLLESQHTRDELRAGLEPLLQTTYQKALAEYERARDARDEFSNLLDAQLTGLEQAQDVALRLRIDISDTVPLTSSARLAQRRRLVRERSHSPTNSGPLDPKLPRRPQHDNRPEPSSECSI